MFNIMLQIFDDNKFKAKVGKQKLINNDNMIYLLIYFVVDNV